MCLGGPNHCRVGWAGSQLYLSPCDRRLCMQLLFVRPCHLFMIHHGCVLFVVGWRPRIKCVDCFLGTRSHTLFKHTHTQKKKIALVTRVGSS
jgi:hypothetical protein